MNLETAADAPAVIRNGHVLRIGPKQATYAIAVERIALAPHAGAPTVTFDEAFPPISRLALTMWAFGRRVEKLPTPTVSGNGRLAPVTGGAL